jgi:hypothetical protein
MNEVRVEEIIRSCRMQSRGIGSMRFLVKSSLQYWWGIRPDRVRMSSSLSLHTVSRSHRSGILKAQSAPLCEVRSKLIAVNSSMITKSGRIHQAA